MGAYLKTKEKTNSSNIHKFLCGSGYRRKMGRPRRTNDGGHTIPPPPPLLAAVFVILLGLISTLECYIHRPNMAVHKRSDAAAAAATISKTSVKVLKPKAKAPKATHETCQRSLRPRRTDSPKENDTNAHIATINMNRDRFVNVLSSLGSASLSKRVTPGLRFDGAVTVLGPEGRENDL